MGEFDQYAQAKIKRYRDEANQCRALAEKMSALPKEHMLDVARQYDKLADEAETKVG